MGKLNFWQIATQDTLQLVTLQSPIANDVDRVGSLQGRFRWSIVQAGVPEPSTWGMMILGLGLIGGAMRRRQQVDYNFA